MQGEMSARGHDEEDASLPILGDDRPPGFQIVFKLNGESKHTTRLDQHREGLQSRQQWFARIVRVFGERPQFCRSLTNRQHAAKRIVTAPRGLSVHNRQTIGEIALILHAIEAAVDDQQGIRLFLPIFQ